jgi:hypothetical protein
MVVQTDSERVRLSRRLILELLPPQWTCHWLRRLHPIWSVMVCVRRASAPL